MSLPSLSTETQDISPSSSPSTRSFVRESLAQGLPIIPFNYPTFVIVEKQRERKKKTGRKSEHEEERLVSSVSEPPTRKISTVRQMPEKGGGGTGEEKSLNKLLKEAKKQLELEQEILKRKVNHSLME